MLGYRRLRQQSSSVTGDPKMPYHYDPDSREYRDEHGQPMGAPGAKDRNLDETIRVQGKALGVWVDLHKLASVAIAVGIVVALAIALSVVGTVVAGSRGSASSGAGGNPSSQYSGGNLSACSYVGNAEAQCANASSESAITSDIESAAAAATNPQPQLDLNVAVDFLTNNLPAVSESAADAVSQAKSDCRAVNNNQPLPSSIAYHEQG